MTLEQLVEKLRKKGNGSGVFLETRLKDLSTLKDIYENSEYRRSAYYDLLSKYQLIYWYIWDLFATEYITKEEEVTLLGELTELAFDRN